MTVIDSQAKISNVRYRNDEIGTIRQLAISIGEQPLDSPIGLQLDEACKLAENCEPRHRAGFIAMLLVVVKNRMVGPTGRRRINEVISLLRRPDHPNNN